MTASGDHHLEAFSANGQWRAEVENPYRMGIDQPNITCRLWDEQNRTLVWEQTYLEESPTPLEILVSDQGQIIWLSHSFKRAAVLLFDTDGLERVRVGLLPTGPGVDPRVQSWVQDTNIKSSTAGFVWTYAAMFTFFEHRERPRFSMRTAWGRRLLFDLENYNYLGSPSDDEVESAKDAENTNAIDLLQSTLKDENDDWHLATLNSLILNRCIEALPLLSDFEQRTSDFKNRKVPTVIAETEASNDKQRVLCALGLRSLGVFPAGCPCHQFSSPKRHHDLAVPLRNGRERDLQIQKLPPTPNALVTLELLGAPDLIRPRSFVFHRNLRPSNECWGYFVGLEENLKILCLEWEFESEESRLAELSFLPVDVEALVFELSSVLGQWSGGHLR